MEKVTVEKVTVEEAIMENRNDEATMDEVVMEEETVAAETVRINFQAHAFDCSNEYFLNREQHVPNYSFFFLFIFLTRMRDCTISILPWISIPWQWFVVCSINMLKPVT